MIYFKKDIIDLSNYIENINYIDIGSRNGINGWFKIIEKKLDIVNFDQNENTLLFNKKTNKKFYLTNNILRSSLFKPNLSQKIYENEESRLNYKVLDVKVDTLDNQLKNFDKKIDLIKIDTQGSEYQILEGGMEVIKRDMPFLFLETWSQPYYEGITLFDEIIMNLRKLGYELYLLDTVASTRVDLNKKFKKNIGKEKMTGFNLFFAPNLEYLIDENNTESKIKKSFLFFIHDLLTFSYKIVENENNDYKFYLEKIIKKRIKYKLYYDLIKLLNIITRYRFFENHKLT